MDPNTLNWDPDPGFWFNLNPVPDPDPGFWLNLNPVPDPDPRSCYQF